MIASFRCKETRSLFDGGTSRRFQAFSAVALRKLDMLDAAVSLDDLRIPPREPARSPQGRQARATQHPHQRPVACVLCLARWRTA